MKETLNLRNEKELKDFVRGCAFYGTGGGGSPVYGYEMLAKVRKEGKSIRAVDVSTVPDDEWTVCAYGMGSIAPRTPQVLEEMRNLGLARPKVEFKLTEAIRELEKHTGARVGVIVSLEIGGANTPDPVATAAHMGIDVVDGDYSGGRAIPEIIQTGPHIAGARMSPLASVDEWGDRVLIKESVNNLVAEKIGKLVSILAYGNLAGNATYLLRAREMKKLVTAGTVSRAALAGKTIREAVEKGEEVGEAVAKKTKGHLLFKGKIVKKKDEDHDGYYWGSNTVEGEGGFKGETFRYWFKNENHLTWLNGKLHVTSPDIICVIDTTTGEPLTNPSSKAGDKVTIIGYASDPRFRTKKALEVLGPKHFGEAPDFVPIERVIGH